MNWNKDSALRFVLDYLKGKLYTNVKLVKKNKFGHCYITTDNGNFYYLFKKDFFHSFNHEFPEYIKQPNTFKGVGESINFEYMKFALNNNATLLFCHEDNRSAIYTPSRDKLLKALETIMPEADFKVVPATALLKIYCDHYDLKRTQDRVNQYKVNDYSENPIEIQEQTYSFSFSLMERLLGKPKV